MIIDYYDTLFAYLWKNIPGIKEVFVDGCKQWFQKHNIEATIEGLSSASILITLADEDYIFLQLKYCAN